MIVKRNYIYYYLAWILFAVYIPAAITGTITLVTNSYHDWQGLLLSIMAAIAPFYFYSETRKFSAGYTVVSATTDTLFKCRVRGTDEIFYLRADNEEEAELYFETVLNGKQVFIEESKIKLLGFEMAVDKTNVRVEK